jgi:hypothetical protein
MNSANPDRQDLLQGIILDDRYAHILVEYDQEIILVSKLKELIETAGGQILETKEFHPEPVKNKAVLFKLNIQDVQKIMLCLSKYPLKNVTCYDSKQYKE